MLNERRRPGRLRVKWPVVVMTTKGIVVAETRDISSDGAFIQCKLPLLPNEKLRLFIMAPNQRALDVAAEVAWSNPHGSEDDNVPRGMGVRFVEVSRDNRNILQNVLARQYKRKSNATSELLRGA